MYYEFDEGYFIADVNNDGAVSLVDTIVILPYIDRLSMGMDVSDAESLFIASNCDYNYDGEISSADADILSAYISYLNSK